jgi:hypothetical protein
MFWQKRDDKKGLPDLPPAKPVFSPQMKKDEVEEKESPKLPSFPEFPEKKEIADAISPPEELESSEEEKDELPELPEMPESKMWKPKALPVSKEITTDDGRRKDIYIKIDRFASAKRALNAAKEKLSEMDELIKKIRETRMREEQELASWEKEVDAVKSKVEDVTTNIFEKTE